ncbi:hypothetical protein GCM10022393_36310 [Aquimarina addita]|uniref:Uncharacterized protein n=1 Tax=Aquimarina addita TaxID=870485 RepID=A0ABP6UR35_9FLAO
MSIYELKKIDSEINSLDERGIQLLKHIYNSNIFKEIKEYQYYSRGSDQFLFSLDRNGKIINPHVVQ